MYNNFLNNQRNLLLLLLLFLFPVTSAVAYEESELPFVKIESLTDFASTKEEALNFNKIIMLEMSASYCGYCETLEEEIIKPMLRSGDYTDNVLIRRLQIDGATTLKDTTGIQLSPAEIAEKYDVNLTPTLLFLDGNGNEVSEKIRGVFSLDFYGGYVDEAIDQGLKVIRNQ